MFLKVTATAQSTIHYEFLPLRLPQIGSYFLGNKYGKTSLSPIIAEGCECH